MDNLAVSLRAAAGNVGAGGEEPTNPNAWDISYADLDHSNSSGFFDIDEMVVVHELSVNAQEAFPRGLFFKYDGTKMYLQGSSGDDVNEYNLSTAWDTSTASYLQSFSVQSQDTAPAALFFRSDGTKMYNIGLNGDEVNEYDLSTGWDVSTASYQQNFSVATDETLPTGLWFKTDGTKMYVVGAGYDYVREYNLSTAWDISTASLNQSFSTAGQETGPRGLCFNPDGTGMWISGTTGDGVDEYSLSTAWDVSTASHVQYQKTYGAQYSSAGSVNTGEYQPFAIFFKPEGDRFYLTGSVSDDVWSFKVGVNYLNVSSEETIPNGVFFKPNGSKVYVIGRQYDKIHEYDLSTAWDIRTASLNQSSASINSVTAAPQGLYIKSDGTKLYTTGSTSDAVHEYDFSTAWDISTISHNQSFSVSSQLATPNVVFFKDDGTKMYLTGNTSDAVFEYDLSTAWDVSTASYSQSFSVASQETAPRGLSFKDDGTKMYVCGSTGDDINEYNLSTAWDISTASYSQNFYVGNIEANLEGMYFKPDGTAFWIIGNLLDRVYQYQIRSS
jgi:DNA-binding beta-propeller fold protein YncE